MIILIRGRDNNAGGKLTPAKHGCVLVAFHVLEHRLHDGGLHGNLWLRFWSWSYEVHFGCVWQSLIAILIMKLFSWPALWRSTAANRDFDDTSPRSNEINRISRSLHVRDDHHLGKRWTKSSDVVESRRPSAQRQELGGPQIEKDDQVEIWWVILVWA